MKAARPVLLALAILALIAVGACGEHATETELTSNAAVVEAEAESTTISTTTSVVPTTAATPSVYSATTLTSEPSTSTVPASTTTTLAPTTTLTTVSTTTETQAPPTTGGTITTGLVIGPSNGIRPEVTPNWTFYDDDDPFIEYHGHWWHEVDFNLPSDPGDPGSAVLDGEANGYARIVFAGSRVRVWCLKNNRSGFVSIELDGASHEMDLYSASTVAEAVWTSPIIQGGYHELIIRAMEDGHPASKDREVWFRGVEVVGKLEEP